MKSKRPSILGIVLFLVFMLCLLHFIVSIVVGVYNKSNDRLDKLCQDEGYMEMTDYDFHIWGQSKIKCDGIIYCIGSQNAYDEWGNTNGFEYYLFRKQNYTYGC